MATMADVEKAKTRSGRKAKHDWSDKRQICWNLYVEEGRPMREIRSYFANALGCDIEAVPHPREFTRQFARWEFPSRQNKWKPTPEEEAALTGRLRQLWLDGVEAKDYRTRLAEDGWDLEEHRIRKLRLKHGFVLRTGNAYDANETPGPKGPRKRKADELAEEEDDAAAGGDMGMSGLQMAAMPHPLAGFPSQQQHLQANSLAAMSQDQSLYPPQGEVNHEDPLAGFPSHQQHLQANPLAGFPSQQQPLQANPLAGLPPQEAARRSARMNELEFQSLEKLGTKKRRRRIRGYGHLGPDEPGPPRYKSETPLDECKALLQMDNDLYVLIRQQYNDICVEMDIRKKTECQPGVWDESKDRLIRESMHLSGVLHPLQPALEQRHNALEVICADVTKRLRDLERKIPLKEANVRLGLTPLESKEVRHQFYQVLEADNFRSKLLCGAEHWEELKTQLFQQSELVQRVYQKPVVTDPTLKKCYGMLLRDAMKRYSDDRVKKDPSLKQHTDRGYGNGPGPARKGPKPKPIPDQQTSTPGRLISVTTPAQSTPSLPPAQPLQQAQNQTPVPNMDPQVDPALWADVSGFTSALAPTPKPKPRARRPVAPPFDPIPAYFRLAPDSTVVGQHPKMWLAKLFAPTIVSLHQAAASKAGAAKVGKVQGVVKGEGEAEDVYLIDGNDELEAYLGTVKEQADGKATFVVVLNGGYA